MRTLIFLAVFLAATGMSAQACFNPPVITSTSPGAERMYVADMNNDGWKDLLTCSILGFGVHLNDGTGGFPAVTNYSVSNFSARALTTLDLKSDGFLDVVSIKSSNSVCVHMNNGSGTLLPPTTFTIPGADVVSADFNEDGKTDLAFGGNGFKIMFGTGTGTLSPPTTFTGTGGFIATADFNSDAHADVAIMVSGSVNVWYGTGTGSFSAAQTVSLSMNSFYISTGDVNGDNRSDIILSGGSIQVLLSNGSSGFIAKPSFTVTGYCNGQVAVADVTGDGFADLVTGMLSKPGINVIAGDGTGNFSNHGQFPGSSQGNGTGAAVDDFNKNGKPDIASVHYYDLVMLMDCQTVGIDENQADAPTIFPNPAADEIVIGNGMQIGDVTVLDIYGRVLSTRSYDHERQFSLV
jgi:hypothetical protein